MSEDIKAEMDQCKADFEAQILKLEDSLNLVWHEIKKLNQRVETCANSKLSGEDK